MQADVVKENGRRNVRTIPDARIRRGLVIGHLLESPPPHFVGLAISCSASGWQWQESEPKKAAGPGGCKNNVGSDAVARCAKSQSVLVPKWRHVSKLGWLRLRIFKPRTNRSISAGSRQSAPIARPPECPAILRTSAPGEAPSQADHEAWLAPAILTVPAESVQAAGPGRSSTDHARVPDHAGVPSTIASML